MKLAVLLTALMLGASSASAATLSQQNPGDVFNGGGKASVSGISNRAGTFSAGGFRLTDGTNNFVAWCLDVLHNLSLPSDYTVTNTPFTNSNTVLLTDAQQSNIASLFTLNYKTPGLLTNNAMSAGFQLALWELVYETQPGPFSISDGLWKATSSLASAVTFANQILASLVDLPPEKQGFKLTFYQSDERGQSLVSATPVPLPAGFALFATALGGLGLFRWIGRRPVAT